MNNSIRKYLLIKEKDQYIKICTEKLNFISGNGLKTNLVGDDFEYETPFPIEAFYHKLPMNDFYWANAHCLVNISSIDQIGAFNIVIGENQIPILPQLKSLILKRLSLS